MKNPNALVIKIALSCVLLAAVTFSSHGQCVGTTTTVSIPRNIGCSYGTGNNAEWDGAVGGVINDPGGSASDFTVTWNATGTFRLKRTFPAGCTGTPLFSSSYTIVAKPATPLSTEVNQQAGCGQVTLNYTGPVYDTYWQISSTGTVETYRTTRIVTATGTYYARSKNSSGCWSDARSITVTSIPPAPVGGTLAGGGTYFIGSVNRTLTLTGYTGTIKEYRYKENGGPDVVVTNTTATLPVSFSNSTTTAISRQYWAVVQSNGCLANSASTTVTVNAVAAPSMTACVGQTTTHTITRNIGCSYGLGNNATFALSSGGTINDPGGSASTFTVTWTTPGTFSLKRTFPDLCAAELPGETVVVYAIPSTPLATEVNQQAGCGQVTLNYTGSVTDTYWQTSATGTVETYRTTRNVTSAGTYYARSKNSIGCWSDARSISVTSVPAVPVGGTLAGGGTYFIGSVNRSLTLSGYTGTVKEYRYKQNGGADVIVANTTATLPVSFSNTTSSAISRQYWAVLQINGCLANSASTTVTVNPVPAPSMTACVGQTTTHTITRNIGCSYGLGYNATFALSSGGTINDPGGSASTFTVTWTTPGTFSLKRTFPDLCAAELPGETVVVSSVPSTPPDPVIVSNCVDVIKLGYPGTPPSGVEWHWQGKNSNGYITNAATTYSVDNPGTYYLRAKKTAGACWSDQSTQKSIQVNDFAWVSPALVDYQCSYDGQSVTLISDNTSDRWFSSPTSTTPLSSTNSLTVSLTATTYYLERTISTGCSPRWPYAIDQNTSLKCTKYLNSVKSTKPSVAVTAIAQTSLLVEAIGYYDGIGRQAQTVLKKGSPAAKDIVQPVSYDISGRSPISYLPYVSTENTGNFKANAIKVPSLYSSSEQYAFYTNGSSDKIQDDTRPYSETIYEPSPLDRPVKGYGPGKRLVY